jgi:hypothetical protein
MNSLRITFLVAIVLLSGLTCPVHSQDATTTQDVSKIRAADFAWMTGRWIGHMQTATAEQICSSVEGGEMLCLFRVFVQGRPAMYELYTLDDTPTGLELRSLHFPTDLTDKALQKPLVMKLQKYSDKEVVFAGAPDSELDTSTLTRDSATTMNGTIIFRNQKEPHIRVRWEKVPYNSKVNYTPSGK